MKYKALKNITSGDLVTANTEDLTVDDLGGQEAVERLERLGAIEKMSGKKKADEDAEAGAAAGEVKGGKK